MIVSLAEMNVIHSQHFISIFGLVYKQLTNPALPPFTLSQGYLRSLGMARTAQVKRDARIGEAEANKDSGIKVMVL